MNALFGLTSDKPTGQDAVVYAGHAWFDPNYRQFLKQTQVPQPAMTWVTLDEHPDSINDGGFAVSMAPTLTWVDVPAIYHNGACGFSFADGHSEIHKWKYLDRIPPIKYRDISGFGGNKAKNPDVQWIATRTSARLDGAPLPY